MLDVDLDALKRTMTALWPKMSPEEIGGWFRRFRTVPLEVMQAVLADWKAANKWSPKYQQIELAIRAIYPNVEFSTPQRVQVRRAGTGDQEFDLAAETRKHNPKLNSWNDAAVLLWYYRYCFFRLLMTRRDREGNVAERERASIEQTQIRSCFGALTRAGYAWEPAENAATWISMPRNAWERFIAEIIGHDLARDESHDQNTSSNSTDDAQGMPALDEDMERLLLGTKEGCEL